jgi:RimJ/RimL family protein N-acetyltransferase
MDSNNVNYLILESILEYVHKRNNNNEIVVDIVMSSSAPFLPLLKTLIANHTWIRLIIDTKEMSTLMLSADIALGACGGTAWERCCLGLPTIAIEMADNQSLVNHHLDKHGAIVNVGKYSELTKKKLVDALISLSTNNNKYKTLVDKSFECCDGLGSVRVATLLLSQMSETSLRPANCFDCEIIFTWQSNKKIRKYFNNSKTPSRAEHNHWFKLNLASKLSNLYIILYKGIRVGSIRFDNLSPNLFTISILVDPMYQGEGIALYALKLFPLISKDGTYFAEVHELNKSSHKLFTKAGFSKISPNKYKVSVINHKIELQLNSNIYESKK